MSISPASSSVTAASLAYIASPDDALDLSNATQSNLTDKLSEAISAQITVSGSLINKLQKINQISSHLQTYGAGSFKPVTTDSLSATPKTSDALKSLFLNSGPSLGSDLADANTTISDLNSLDISINAPKLTPMLIETSDNKGKLISKSFAWYSDDQIKNLGEAPIKSPIYPGTNERLKIASGLITVYRSFDQYAKLTPSQTDVNTTIAKITALAKSLDAEFASMLDKASEDSDKLQTIINDNADSKKSQSQQISALATQQKEQVSELLKKLRVLKLEREANMQRQENKIGPEIISIVKNASSRVEGISRVDADTSSQSASIADANDGDLQLQQTLTGLAAGPNTNTPDNRIPV